MAVILITGGAGFIGSYVVKELLKEGHTPVVYDAFLQYVSPLDNNYQAHVWERFKDIRDKVIIERGDTREQGNIARVIGHYRPERIIHLAALPIADLSNKNPEEALSTIIEGTVNVLEAVRNASFVKRFVYASSSMIYGDFTYEPVDEEHPKRPKDIYGGTKFAGEVITEAYGRRFGIKYTIVRPSAVYGPTDINRRVSQIFLEDAMADRELTLHGGGEEKLDFTHVEDTAHGFVLAAFRDEATNEVFNITRGQGRSLREFTDILRNFFPNLKIAEKPRNVFRPKRGALDISKARRMLNYNPRYSLEEGIAQYVGFMKTKAKSKEEIKT